MTSAASGPAAIFSMYTHGPGSNIVPRSLSAITEIAPRATERRERGAVDRVDGDVHRGRGAVADLLAVEQHRRFVFFALADHDDAVHRDAVEDDAHRLDGRAVGGVLVAASHPAAAGERGGLGGTHQFHREVAIRALCSLHCVTLVGRRKG